MRMAHGSHQIMPASLVSLIPDGIDLKDACWAGLAKTAFRAAWAGEFKQRDSLLIVGAGPVGQMLLRWAVADGVDRIAVCDLFEHRLEHARRGGATEVFGGLLAENLERIGQMNNGLGPPVVVDTTGNPAAFPAALAAAAKFGKVVLLGDSGFPGKQCLTSDVMTKGLTIQATHDSHDLDGWTQRRIDERFFGLVARDKFDLKGLITHEFQPADCVAAYVLASDSREQAIGILYDWTKIKE